MKLSLPMLITIPLLLTACAIDQTEYNQGYYTSHHQQRTPPEYYPDAMTSGYNRDYSTSQTTSSSSATSASVTQNNGYATSG